MDKKEIKKRIGARYFGSEEEASEIIAHCRELRKIHWALKKELKSAVSPEHYDEIQRSLNDLQKCLTKRIILPIEFKFPEVTKTFKSDDSDQ